MIKVRVSIILNMFLLYVLVKSQTSKYNGVCWNKDRKKWKAQLGHNKIKYYGGYFDEEEHAAMKVNLLCDKYKIERKNPTIEIKPDIRTWEKSQVLNKTSKYTSVSWHKDKNKWTVKLKHKGKEYYGGYFDNEEHAAMEVNLLCDKYEIERKNPMIEIAPDAIQKVTNKTSIYNGVSWSKDHKCWQANLMHNRNKHYGGYFDNEEHAAMKVNLFCDKYEIARKNLMINLNLDQIQRIPKTTSKYTGVSWSQNRKSWKVELNHNQKKYFGGYFNNEEQAAMKVNLLCDNIRIKRKHPTVNLELNEIQNNKGQTSKYIGVCWDKDRKKWRVDLKQTDKKQYFGGYFDNEEHAAMKVNLICDKFKIERKNPMIIMEPDAIQKISNKTSKYTGITWNKKSKCWQAQFQHNKKNYYAGLFDKEEHAAMKINSICDTIEIKHKNPEINKDGIQKTTQSKMSQYATENIVNEQVKVENENILDRFKDECENRFTQQSNDEKRYTAKEFQNSKVKRKRKQNFIILNDDVKEEKVEITTTNHDENELLEKIQINYTKIQD